MRKLHNTLYKWSALLKQKGLYFEIKSHITDKYFIKIMSERDRAIGKTYTLMKLSKKYNIPVLEPNESAKYTLRKQYKESIVISPIDLRGTKYQTILIDERQLLSEDVINFLSNNGTKLVGIMTC